MKNYFLILTVIIISSLVYAGCLGGGSAVDPNNSPPVASLQIVSPAMPCEGWDSGTRVEFDASGSYDPDRPDNGVEGLTLIWDFDGDRNFDEPEDRIDDGSAIRPVKYFTAAPANDRVAVLVTDDSGLNSIIDIEVGFVFRQSKNINITIGNRNAIDICLDHKNGDALVLYTGGLVRRYTASSFFQSYTDIYVGETPWPEFIDSAINGNWTTVFLLPNNRARQHHFNLNDVEVYQNISIILPVTGLDVFEAICFYNIGNHDNNNVMLFGTTAISGIDTIYRTRYFSFMDEAIYSKGTAGYFNSDPAPYTGENQLCWSFVTGAEACPGGDYIWFLEKDDHRAHRMAVGSPMTFSATFGTGSPGTDPYSINDGLDITCGKVNHMYILDRHSSSEYAIKAFVFDTGNLVTSKTLAATEWTSKPIRIDASKLRAEMLLLMSENFNSYISVFTGNELP